MTRILVVEDSRTQAHKLKALLNRAGMDAEVATNGAEALERFEAAAFDLVISDVVMPEMSGFELCRRIKSLPVPKRRPVILLTALGEPQDILQGLECGADNFIAKPYESDYLTSRIEGILRQEQEEEPAWAEESIQVTLADREFTISCSKQHILRFLVSALDDYARARLREERANLELIKHRHEVESQRLRERAAMLEETARAKEEFLANMSHELRTPLNAVIGFSQGLLDRRDRHPLDEHQQDRLRRIKESGGHLLALINDFLDVTKVEAGRMQVNNAPFMVEKLAEEIAGLAEGILQDKPQVQFVLDVEQNLPELNSDADKIRQILINLLSNAIKFTEQGTVTLRIQSDSQSIWFSVEDTGIGIAEEHLDRIFDKFFQVGQTGLSVGKGTGLGLSICNGLAALLDGQLTVRSVVGSGSTFTLHLPLVHPADGFFGPAEEPPEDESPNVMPDGTESHAKILCVEDNPQDMILLRDCLVEAGYDLIPAVDGPSALQLAVSEQPQAIVLDVDLPGINGWEVLRRLKADPATRDIPVVMTTAMHDELLGFRLGAADYLLKPVNKTQVLRAIWALSAGD